MWGHKKFLTIVVSCITQKKGLRFKHDKYASEQTEVASIIYNLEKFSKVFFTYLYSLFFFYIMYIFWTHLFRMIIIVHQEVDKAFVSSGYLKSQSFKCGDPFCFCRAGYFISRSSCFPIFSNFFQIPVYSLICYSSAL